MSKVLKMQSITAFVLDGREGARPVTSEELSAKKFGGTPSEFLWVHLNRGAPEAISWLKKSGIDHFILSALTAEETRPRCTVHGDGAILNLRGINLNPGAEPEDMISIRIWIEKKRVISVGMRPLMAVRDLLNSIERNQAPISPGDLISKLALRLADQAEPTISNLNEKIDVLEELILDDVAQTSRKQLSDIRRTSIVLRRYMFPQRDALTTLQIEDFKWLSEHDRNRVREAAERVTRLGEELDAIRDRAQVVHDQIVDMRAEAMNRQMLVLSIVAAVFLPLGLLTGLLGINVGGIPGSNNPWAFSIVCGLLIAIGASQVWFFKRISLF
ncbi:MAG: zinc transporter ZntB [Fimbriimonadaceae bacterium]|nr:zinc transporter ZntB [Alphaproteobacteria bacterium]